MSELLYAHFHQPEAGGVAHTLHPHSDRVFGLTPGSHGGWLLRDPHNPQHRAEDAALLKAGILDPDSLVMGYVEQRDPIRVLVHDESGRIKHIRHNHNLRINYGGNLLLKMLMAADSTGTTNTPNVYYCTQATITYAATSVTPSTSPVWTAHAYQDHFCVPYTGGVIGVIADNTATALTIDQWYAITAGTVTNPMTGAAGTTPAANTQFVITPGGAPLLWVALSNDAAAAATTDTTLAGEVTTSGLARKFAGGSATAYSTVTTAATGGTTTNVTCACKVHLAWTATGTVTAIQKAGLLDVSTGGNPSFEGVFTSFGTNSGDSVTLDWTITNS